MTPFHLIPAYFMFKSICKRLKISLTLALLISLSANAATLQVYPVNIDFSQEEKVKAVYVSNAGSTAINAQIRIFLWEQQNDKNKLSETKNIIVSPPITDIPSGQQQLIRIIIPGPKTAGTEQSYRLVIDELPGNDSPKSDGAVNFLLRYSLPVFISTPEEALDNHKIEVRINRHTQPATLQVRNSNTQHIKLSDVAIINNGKEQIINKGLLGYVLANSQMQWPIPGNLPSGQTLKVTINEHSEPQNFVIHSD